MQYFCKKKKEKLLVNVDCLHYFILNDTIVDFVMVFTKLNNSIARLHNHLLRYGQNNADKVRIVETLTWQAEDTLLLHQVLHKQHFGWIFRKVFDINADHHVHGTVWHDRRQSRSILQNFERKCCMFL